MVLPAHQNYFDVPTLSFFPLAILGLVKLSRTDKMVRIASKLDLFEVYILKFLRQNSYFESSSYRPVKPQILIKIL